MSEVLSAASELDWSWLPEGTPAPTSDLLLDARRQTTALLADRGVTYGPGGGLESAWRLDPVPVVVDESDWAPVEAAVAQRAAVLDAVLADVYSRRTLLTDGLLPPELVLTDPGFLRPVDGIVGAGPRRLVLHAADLARDPSGRWLAVADRAQAPSGAAYAMVDRRVVAQSMARVYRRTSIRRIGPFFHALRRALDAAAPPGTEQPNAVLLTPGPHSETAFDQAYLATMLGVPLVEGEDLVVRDGRVWLEGMAGPEPVDVVLRRVDAQWCDPLDLRADSRLGVPGLVRALRAGTVAVVNPLGAGILEHPGLPAYLPRIARAVLGEDLALPSPATWWCGEPAARSHALAHLDTLVLKHSGAHRERTVLGWRLDRAARESLAARIAADPLHWTAQEPVSGATAPPYASAPSVLRTFAVADEEGYRVLAGGLALQAPPGEHLVSSSRGAVAVDVCGSIAADSEATPTRGRSASRRSRRRDGGCGLRTAPSAENMFSGSRATPSGPDDPVRVMRAVVDRWCGPRAPARRCRAARPWPCCSTRWAPPTPPAGPSRPPSSRP